MDIQDQAFKAKVQGVQVLYAKQGKPTKYKMLEPTLAVDLCKHVDKKYKMPSESELDNLTEDDLILVAFINRADVWLYVERVDEEEDIVYGKLCNNMKRELDLQQNQRVAVRKEHVVGVRFHDADDDDGADECY